MIDSLGLGGERRKMRPSTAYESGKVHWMKTGPLAEGGGEMWCGHTLKVSTHPVNKYTTSRKYVTCQTCLGAQARAAIAQAKGTT